MLPELNPGILQEYSETSTSPASGGAAIFDPVGEGLAVSAAGGGAIPHSAWVDVFAFTDDYTHGATAAGASASMTFSPLVTRMLAAAYVVGGGESPNAVRVRDITRRLELYLFSGCWNPDQWTRYTCDSKLMSFDSSHIYRISAALYLVGGLSLREDVYGLPPSPNPPPCSFSPPGLWGWAAWPGGRTLAGSGVAVIDSISYGVVGSAVC